MEKHEYERQFFASGFRITRPDRSLRRSHNRESRRRNNEKIKIRIEKGKKGTHFRTVHTLRRDTKPAIREPNAILHKFPSIAYLLFIAIFETIL